MKNVNIGEALSNAWADVFTPESFDNILASWTFEERLDALMTRRRANRARYTFDAIGSRYYESLE